MKEHLQIFPALDDATEAALRASIERHGVLVPVVKDQHGRILDGHHRARIAGELGVRCPTKRVEVGNDDHAYEIAGTLNLARRHLEPPQRRCLAADLRADGHSLRAIAKALGVSKSQVANDLDELSRGGQFPDRITGIDGKSRPAARPRARDVEPGEADDLEAAHWLAKGRIPPTRPACDIEPGDVVVDDSGDAREISHVDVCDELDEVTLFDDAGDAITVGADRPVTVEPRREIAVSKPDLGGGISHPARFSTELLDLFRLLLIAYAPPGGPVLDPFAGTGRIHELQADGWQTVGVELSREYADMHPDTIHGDARDLPFDPDTFGAIVTSPTYGNRLADSHNASDPELRRSYTHDLGRPLDAGNSGVMHWRTSPPGREAAGSADYRILHEKAWAEALRVLRPGGVFLLNCCDHVRDGLVQPVTAWHCWALGRLGLDYIESRSVPTRKLRQGANADLREQEQIHVFRKPS